MIRLALHFAWLTLVATPPLMAGDAFLSEFPVEVEGLTERYRAHLITPSDLPGFRPAPGEDGIEHYLRNTAAAARYLEVLYRHVLQQYFGRSTLKPEDDPNLVEDLAGIKSGNWSVLAITPENDPNDIHFMASIVPGSAERRLPVLNRIFQKPIEGLPDKMPELSPHTIEPRIRNAISPYIRLGKVNALLSAMVSMRLLVAGQESEIRTWILKRGSAINWAPVVQKLITAFSLHDFSLEEAPLLKVIEAIQKSRDSEPVFSKLRRSMPPSDFNEAVFHALKDAIFSVDFQPTVATSKIYVFVNGEARRNLMQFTYNFGADPTWSFKDPSFNHTLSHVFVITPHIWDHRMGPKMATLPGGELIRTAKLVVEMTEDLKLAPNCGVFIAPWAIAIRERLLKVRARFPK